MIRALVFILLVFLQFGCGPSEPATTKAARDGVLLINNRAEPRDLDHHVVSGFPENRVIKALMEGLVSEHPNNSNYVSPGIAEKWEPNEDYSVWTFYLRESRWANGDALTAHDFVYAYHRILHPDLGAPYAGMLSILKNADPFNRGEIPAFEEVGVKALDDLTLQLELTGPTPYFPLKLTHYTWFPIHRPTIERHNAFSRRDTGWTRPENHIGNGPFVLTEWRPNQRITVSRNSYYWDHDNVQLQAIQFYPIQDAQTEERMFQTGQLHKTDSVPFNNRDHYRERNDPAFRQEPFFATGYVGLNLSHSALSEQKVRRALMHAIDRERIVERVSKNGKAATGFVPRGIEGFPYADHLEFNPEKGRQLLREAGYPEGRGLPRINLMIANVDTSRTLAEVLQSMWSAELGIDVQIQNREWQVLISDMDSGNFDMFLLSWVGDYMDPATFLNIMRSHDGNNRTGFASEEYDGLLAKAGQTVDPDERFQILARAEKLLLEEMPIIPLSFADMMYLLDPMVKGWNAKQLADQPYKYIYFDTGELP